MKKNSTKSTAKMSKEEIIQNAIRICAESTKDSFNCFLTREEYEDGTHLGEFFIDYDEEVNELKVESCRVDVYMIVSKDGYEFHNETGYDLNEVYDCDLDAFSPLEEMCELVKMRCSDLDSLIADN